LASRALVKVDEVGKPEKGALMNIFNIQDNPTPAKTAKSNIQKGQSICKG
jgi:hypothetical protein